MTDRRTVRTWAEVDLDALAHNYRLLRGLAPGAKFLGLVKADAYGHGAVQSATVRRPSPKNCRRWGPTCWPPPVWTKPSR